MINNYKSKTNNPSIVVDRILQFQTNMIFNGNRITGPELSECFAEFFDKKVLGIVESTKVDQGVYNGRRKIHAEDGIFMTSARIIECVKSLKIKNTEGYDRIPQRIIIDGLDALSKPLTKLFELVYRDTKIPGQWHIKV